MNKIYLDHAATSPVHPHVAEKMVTILTESFGNPSSIHSFGREARRNIGRCIGKNSIQRKCANSPKWSLPAVEQKLIIWRLLAWRVRIAKRESI